MAIGLLFVLFGAEADPGNKIEKYWANLEAQTFHDVERARQLWDGIMKNHQRESDYWLAYFRFERQAMSKTMSTSSLFCPSIIDDPLE